MSLCGKREEEINKFYALAVVTTYSLKIIKI